MKTGGFTGDYYGGPKSNYRKSGYWQFYPYVAALQYIGSGDHHSIAKTMNLLDQVWEGVTVGSSPYACCPVRGNYWATMIYFNTQGPRWDKWNASMNDCYVKSQKIEKGKYKDHKGRPCAIGYWHCADQHIGTQPFMPTVYIGLQLMVYYRFLPTKSANVWAENYVKPTKKVKYADEVDISVEI